MTDIDKKKAQTNPSSEFENPRDVVESDDLSKGEKKKALAAWELDARLMQVAAEEGMAGGELNRLAEVKKAQADLAGPEKIAADRKADDDKAAPAPTKTGG